MRKKVVALTLALSLAWGLLTGCGSSSSTAGSGSLAGTYEGTGEGRNGDIVVAVTLDDAGAITGIEVTEEQETDGIGSMAFFDGLR